MAISSLNKSLKKVCQSFLNLPLGKHSLPIPYWSNKLKDGKILIEGAFGGKGTPKQIQKATDRAAKKEKLDLKKLTKKEILYLMKRNKIGLDCSGLVYQLLDFISKKEKKTSLDQILVGFGGKKGIRRVGVRQLADPQNSIPVNLDQLKPGDFIITDQEKHMLLILDIKDNKITYIHSSQKTKNNGVHLGTLTIINPNRGLAHQKWSDKLKDGSPYTKTIYENDGFYRLKTLL